MPVCSKTHCFAALRPAQKSNMDMGAETSLVEKWQVKSSGNKSSVPVSSGSEDDITYCGFDINALPHELLVLVLNFVPAEDVVKRCSCVCKYWLALCRDLVFWRRKCDEERRYVPGIMPLPRRFMVFYVRNPYRKNLLRNTRAENLRYWKTRNRRMLSIEEQPAGSDPIADYVPAAERQGEVVRNWVTSSEYSEMSQKIYLLKKGCSTKVLDKFRPPIYVSVWCSAHGECGSAFYLKVTLLDQHLEYLDQWEQVFDMTDNALRGKWHKLEHTFAHYRSGLRRVFFVMGGLNTQCWPGNYGSKFTLPCLRFVFRPNGTEKEIADIDA